MLAPEIPRAGSRGTPHFSRKERARNGAPGHLLIYAARAGTAAVFFRLPDQRDDSSLRDGVSVVNEERVRGVDLDIH